MSRSIQMAPKSGAWRIGAWLFGALAAMPLLATTALAQPTSAQQAALKSSCQADYRAKCASVPPGGSAALQCLQQNLAGLSAACQQAVTAASGGSAPAEATPATSAPAAKPAAAKPPAAKPAAPAAAAVPLSPRQEMMLVRQSCGRDFNRYCSTVPLGRGNAVACLRANAARLSATCKQALAAAGR